MSEAASGHGKNDWLPPRRLESRLRLGYCCVKMVESLLNGEGIHFSPCSFAGFEDGLQVVTGDLNRQRIGNYPAGTFLILNPRWMRQGDPEGPPIYQELDVHGVGMARGNGYDECLVDAVNFLLGPAVDGREITEHTIQNYIGPCHAPQTSAYPLR